MIDRRGLIRLAGLAGIEVRYTDALGRSREASDETLLALVDAFGLPADPRQAMAELMDREQARPFGLGPVHIGRAEDSHPMLAIRPPRVTRRIAWTCELESGEQYAGDIAIRRRDRKDRFDMPLPAGLPLGYHRLTLDVGGLTAQTDLIVAPQQCHLSPQLAAQQRCWGVTCQLHALRSAHNWGIGDLTDLGVLVRNAASCGAAVLGINPLHARFAAEPRHCSPYSPSSRTQLEYLYIDPTIVPGFGEDETTQALIHGERFGALWRTARSASLIDHSAVAACKRPVLEALYRRFRALDLGENKTARSALGDAFRQFQRSGGRSLIDFAVFETLHEHYCGERRGFSWCDWPAPMRDPRSAAVADFAAAHHDRVEFFEFLQWQADRQLAGAAAAGHDAGLSIGLYRDLAVGADPNGAEAWADQELVAPRASIGAPPDALSRAGQNWGLAPINPLVLRRQRFAPFIANLRANMRHAGLLRIDHVMSLSRLYWIPNGMDATAGSYVRYPFDDLLRLVALESCRQGCAVVGEDLGTVPGGFRETMRATNVLSYRIMMFERNDGGFVPPVNYPPLAAASAATHDLATLAGFWLGRDLDWRRRLSLYPDELAATTDMTERDRDRHLLLRALAREGLLAPEDFGRFWSETGEPVYLPELGEAILRYLARSQARLMLVQIEDVVGEIEQANLPGTFDAHPNWRRRLGQTLEDIADGTELRRLAALIREARQCVAADDPAS